jgi:uncharacterized membrane protein
MLLKFINFFQRKGLLKALLALMLIVFAILMNNHLPQLKIVWEIFAYVSATYLSIAASIGIVFGGMKLITHLKNYFN